MPDFHYQCYICIHLSCFLSTIDLHLSAFELCTISRAVLQSCSSQAFLTGSCVSICSQHLLWCLIADYSPFTATHFLFNAFFLTLIHLFSPGRLRHGLFELHILIVLGNLMPRDLLFSSPLLSFLLRPGGVLNGNTLLWITQQGAPWLIALLTIY